MLSQCVEIHFNLVSHEEKFHNSCCSSGIIRMIKTRRLRRGLVARLGAKGNERKKDRKSETTGKAKEKMG
jgi:hypothetical protein